MKLLALAVLAAMPLIASATGPASPWNGKTWLVAANGLDSPTCGEFPNACRSITQAMANAVDGDTILVRPGLYGDLNADGVLAGPGEEHSARFIGAVELNKRLRVLSTDGAAATTINVNGALTASVAILAPGSQFGERNAGFTVLGALTNGIQCEVLGNAVIAGNIVRKNGRPELPIGVGIYVNTSGFVEIRDNLVYDNVTNGLTLFAPNNTGYVIAHDNVVSGSKATFTSPGIVIADAQPHVVYHNVISDNSIGLIINSGASRVYDNLVTANRDGAWVGGAVNPVPARVLFLQRNSFTANLNYGVYILAGTPGNVTIRENNFFGNRGSCGIASQSADVIDARNNYWGAATGPSWIDPADEACAMQGSITTTPFATREFR